jgi:hypothetical protein
MKKNKPVRELFYHSLKKTLLIMRIAFVLLIAGILQATATEAYAQKTRLSLDFSDANIVTVLDKIEQESEFFFLYNEKLLDTERNVDINADDQPINVILDNLFAGTNVKYTIVDRKIILAPEYLTETASQQSVKISGKVTGTAGDPLPGVNVTVKGTTIGVNTGIDGTYNVEVPNSQATLQFSFIGYAPQEVIAGTQSVINITLVESMLQIDEVVVTAFGIKKEKKALAYAVQEVRGEKHLPKHV